MSTKPVQRKRANTQHKASSEKTADAPDPDESIYQPRHPVLLLLCFLLALLGLSYIGYHFYHLRLHKNAALQLQREESEMQLSQARQVELNAGTKEKWLLYAEHRGNVTKILKSLVKKQTAHQQGGNPASLVILGAGNLNDVLLSQLLPPIDHLAGVQDEYFDSLALVDLDAAAMQRGLLRQQQQTERDSSASMYRPLDSAQLSRIHLYSSELTGSFSRFDRWRKDRLREEAFMERKWGKEKRQPTQSERERSAVGSKTIPPQRELDEWQAELQLRPGAEYRREKGLPHLDSRGEKIQFSSVASICLLSQLLDMYMRAVDEHHTGFLPGALSLREAHFALLLDLLAPGGNGMLITDIVASTTVPELKNITQKELPSLLQKLLDTSNFFTGTNPLAIRTRLSSHPDIVPSSVEILEPWLWKIGPEETNSKVFLVYAIGFRRRPT